MANCRSLSVILLVLYAANSLWGQCGDCEYLSENLVVNGDFESGDTGFDSDYAYATVNGPWGLLSFEGVYVVGANAANFHTFFQGFDHTNPPTGQYMIVNGSSVPNTNVWCQSITVQPNTWYTFAAWARNVDTNPNNNVYANLQFNINGQPLGANAVISGGWTPFNAEWFSGANTDIEICLVNNQTNGGGNDFGIDDISFTTCIPYDVQTTPSAGENTTICSGESVTLGEPAYTNFSYSWTGQGINGSTNANPQVNLNNPGPDPIDFTFTLETDSSNTGCFQLDEVTVTVNPNPQPDLGPDMLICEGEEATLNAGNGWESVLWSTNETTSSIVVDAVGNYTVTVTLLDCEGSDNITITQPPLPDIQLGPDTSICVDESIVFSSSGVNGLWSTGEQGSSIEANQEGWYWLQAENQGCTTRDSVFLSVIQYPELSLEEFVEICPDDSYTFYTLQPGQWSTGQIADSLVVTQPGVYSVILNNQQCAVYAESEVIALEYPFVDLGEDQVLCLREVVKFSVEGAYNDEVFWADGSTEFEREISETGIYSVLAVNQCGTDESSVSIQFDDCDYGLYVPNAFTPDGDGLNEVWRPVPLNLERFEVLVFNRWGELVWQSNTPGEGWNGNHQSGGYYVPDGIYIYRASGTSIQGKPVEDQGFISILR